MTLRQQRFGERIREARQAANLTQDAVARALKVKQPTVSSWEIGETYPTPGNLLRFCELTNVDVVPLLELMVEEAEAIPA